MNHIGRILRRRIRDTVGKNIYITEPEEEGNIQRKNSEFMRLESQIY